MAKGTAKNNQGPLAASTLASAVAPGASSNVQSDAAGGTAATPATPGTESAQSTSNNVGGASSSPTPAPATVTPLTPVQSAAQFVGIPVDQVLDFKAYGDRFVVVTTSGHKLSTTAAERAAQSRAAAMKAAK